MTNIEKLIKGLEMCPSVPYGLCYDCGNLDCPCYAETGIEKMHAEAIEIIKKELPVKPVYYDNNFLMPHCGHCGKLLQLETITLAHPKYCSNCGTKISW